MSVDDNIHTVENVREALNVKDFDRCLRFYSDLIVFSGPDLPQPITGKAMLRQYYQNLAATFPDFRIEETDVFGHGERICAEWAIVGTHKGPLPGPGGGVIPPTNKRIRNPLVLVFALESGRIVKEREYFDLAGLMTQLGL